MVWAQWMLIGLYLIRLVFLGYDFQKWVAKEKPRASDGDVLSVAIIANVFWLGFGVLCYFSGAFSLILK